ncbi:acyltransferase [Desulforhabdus sp. TSK]|uniref:acyltransferase family protein n=1 Tax=Desulforhabdus sp. TSK TaxID=2925014 RepID=UPI001FC8B9CB|nr:acyltransferase [Desulforhabdus sp. TSK]GKT07865.1 hypothetical protein DSTSK_11700 [Desulforhabdus sp. TSK]
MPQRINFVDWLKSVGMFLIVFGHVVGPPFNQFTQPIYPKQLGVALFIFVMGWSLANEERPRWRVAFNRLFPVYLFGIGSAVLLSGIVFLAQRDLNPSNYLPFMMGINVFLNYFPANPTTWYIGTYVHVILIWCFFLQGRNVPFCGLGLALVVEIGLRAAIMYTGYNYTAYMILPNWATVFLLGMYLRDRGDLDGKAALSLLAPLWFLSLFVWATVFNPYNLDKSFPFRDFPGEATVFSLLARSGMISFLYLFHVLLLFQIFRRIQANGVVRFFSRNTLLIFILHMPFLYAFHSWVYRVIPMVWLKKSVMILLMYGGIGLFSEVVLRIVKPNRLRERVWEKGSALFEQ